MISFFDSEALAASLSCNMQRTLVTLAAKARDAGMPSSQVRQSLSKDEDLSSLEISEIVRAAYVIGKNLPPEALGIATYNSCKKPSDSRGSENSKTFGLSCHDVGYRYAYTAIQSMNGVAVNPR